MAKHHYLPQFYLKGFTNAVGLFMIYSVKEARFKRGGQFFTPASHFYLPDDNTVLMEGVPDDYLEAIYSVNETRYARILNKIRAIDQGFGLDNEDVIWLNYFAGELYWRVPAQRPLIEGTTGLQRLNELLVERRGLTTRRLIDAPVFGEQRRDRRRHLVPGRGEDSRRFCSFLDC